MSEQPQVFAAFLAVKRDLDAITKSKRVTEGPARFNFRGVDDVMNALHEPMARHGLICVPQVQERLAETRATSKGGTMNVVHVRVRFAFYAADGSTFAAEVWGEGQDSGDKATGKAHSMAYKSALLEAFHVPTEDIPDADYDSVPATPVQQPRRSPASAPQPALTPDEKSSLRAEIVRLCRDRFGMVHTGEDGQTPQADVERIAREFGTWAAATGHGPTSIPEASAALLTAYRDHLYERLEQQAAGAA